MKLITGGWIWRGADTTPEPRPENLLIDGNRIVAVGPDVAHAGAEVIDATGMLVLPGLVNAHFHSPVNHMKGRLPSLPLEIFMLYESPSLDVLRPTPREAYVRTLLACMEMLRTGVTAVQDDAFFVPHPSPEIIDAVAQAYADCGIRARLALDQSNLPELAKLPYLDALLPDNLRAALATPPAFGTTDLLAAYDHLITTWHGAAGRPPQRRGLLLRAPARHRRLRRRPATARRSPRPAVLCPHPRNPHPARLRRGMPRRPLARHPCRRTRHPHPARQRHPRDLGRRRRPRPDRRPRRHDRAQPDQQPPPRQRRDALPRHPRPRHPRRPRHRRGHRRRRRQHVVGREARRPDPHHRRPRLRHLAHRARSPRLPDRRRPHRHAQPRHRHPRARARSPTSC